YARVRKPQVPVLDISGIEKSSFRSLMDKKSEGVRKGLAKTFGKKKKEPETRSSTAASTHEQYETEPAYYAPHPAPHPPVVKPIQTQYAHYPEQPDYMRPGPPLGKLPPIPQGPQLKRWLGGGRPAQPWNKLRKDPELWDANGDTLIYFSHGDPHSPRPLPSFRISSHVLEATESRYFINALREGSTEDTNSSILPPSPLSDPSMRLSHPMATSRYNHGHHTPPMSENSTVFDGQISYELYFPPPAHLSKTDAIRHQIATRNVLAILYQVSFVGINLFQALNDVHERLESYMPPETDVAAMIIDYVVGKGMDDVRESPAIAASMLAWSEGEAIRWEGGWREAFVHSVGMYSKVESAPDFRFVTPITRALLERASLELEVRIQNCEARLVDFDFGDMWPMMPVTPSDARKSFENLRKFFLQYYQNIAGSWPPPAPAGEEQWLTREWTRKLQEDFGALYNFFVNREVRWESTEASAGRKWNIVHDGNRSFDADTPGLPFTDILVGFDNRNKYPHIPHPYPLVPESMPPIDDKMAERRAALAYTESTNIYLLGSDFVPNDLVDQFVKFEKTDKAAESDPFEARRGRWILIYGILQTLATISVDTPDLRYTKEVSYHLNPRLKGTPPWLGATSNLGEASHTSSYCWTIPTTWSKGSS
ncbi:hypothetical protein M430DRAFT_84639, partial [Amorphotheca resinae ATCC 22711]